MLIVRPVGNIAKEGVQLSAVPAANSLSVGILDNRKDNAGRLLAGIRAQIVSRLAARAGAVCQKSYVNIPARAEALLSLSESSNLVLVGSGD